MKVKMLFLIAFVLSGCAASGPYYTESIKADSELAIVYLYRPSRFFQGGGGPDIYVDGAKVFRMLNGGFNYLKLSEGEHVVSPRKHFNWGLDVSDTKINVEAGKKYYLKMVLTNENVEAMLVGSTAVASVSGNTRFIKVATDVAEKEMKLTRYSN